MHRTDTTDRTSSGVVKTGGITSIGSGIITGLTTATDINVGDWVTISAGFNTQRFRVSANAAAQITVLGSATSSETGVTVTVVADMYTIGDGVAINRTVYGPDQANAVQEEIVNAIEAVGLVLNKNDNRQLQFTFVKVNGGSIVGDLDIVGALIANSVALHKKNGGTAADAVNDLKFEGSEFIINSLAPNTSVALFNFGSVLDEQAFYLDVLMEYRISAQDRVAHTRLIAKTGALSPTGIWGVAPQWAVSTQDSNTPVNLGGYYINLATANDTDFDGVGNKNGIPSLIMTTAKMELRNTHNTDSATNIKARIISQGLF